MKRLTVVVFVIAAFVGGVAFGGRFETAEAQRRAPAASCRAELDHARAETERARRIAAVETERAIRAEVELARALERERRRVQMLEARIGQVIHELPE